MNAVTLLLVILVVLLVFGGLPQVSGHWHNLGYGISGVGLVLVIILVVVLLSGRL
jgi:protein-S-isoprenylcysteine O-methyltransferase Ste14